IFSHIIHEAARIERTKLYLAALKGDWKSVENMQEIQRKITKAEETTLHVAAVANKEDFVRNLVSNGMSSDDLKVENIAGNTALSYAAATGNVNIAKVMVEKNKDLANLGSGVKPIFMAASLGHSQMVQFLYSETNEMVCQWDENEQAELFITCVKGGLYGIALEMLKANPNFATAKDELKETTLHVLARNPSAFVSGSRPGLLRRHLNIPWLKLKEEKSKQSQAHELLKQCLQAYKDDIENLNEISELSLVLFIAAEVGNVEFLVELIHFDLDLLWKIDDKKRSIFHIAVEKRHESIFNLLVEVEKAVRPGFKEMKNVNGETPYVLFAKSHKKLRKQGEKWMMNMAKSSMVVATLIGTIAFSYQPDDKLDHQSPKLGLAYSVSSAIAVFCSSTSLITFLSILTSSYSYEDFLVSLPVKLMIGVTTLFVSIAAMMVAFSASFCMKNHNHQELPLIFFVIGLFACVPILYVLLKYRLLVDIVQCTCFRLQPRHRLPY
ncbi:ankyrin repeat domain-containing protein 17, partial [Quercus suber]